MNRVELNPDWPWSRDFRISQGVRVGETVYVSGQGPIAADGRLVGANDMLTQSRQVFDNIHQVLALAGATLDDVVKITAFLTDLDRYDEYKAARAEAFLDRIPASSTVHSPQLLIPGMMVEVETVAVLTLPRSSAPE